MKPKNEPSALEFASQQFEDYSPYQTVLFSLLRFFNYSFLVLFILALLSSLPREETNIKNSYLILVFFLSPIVALLIRHIIKRKHKFDIWDKVEREKREEFIDTVSFFVYTFTFISMFILFNTIDSFTKISNISKPEIFSLSLGFFYSSLFMVNAMFPVQLMYHRFSDIILRENLIAKKPDNWDWDSKKER